MALSFKTFLMLASVVSRILIAMVSLSCANLIPQQVPCLFIIGDSLFDNGNNNGLITTAKANYPPYGIDFPDGPTGRFTNGRNMADIIATLLGFDDYIKPYTTATDKDILKGVNYASGSSGIRDETGSHLGDRISLNRQLKNHQATISRIASLLGDGDAASKYINKCIHVIGMGSNDYINNYLMPQYYVSSSKFRPQEYAKVLAQQYSQQLRTLYKNGARKIAIFGLAQIGSIPFEVVNTRTNGSKGGVKKINGNVQLFNDQLKSLVDDLNHDFVDARFTYINVAHIQSGASFSSLLGFDMKNPCCIISTTIAKGQCVHNKNPCIGRLSHAFWDAFHPTEISNTYVATRAYNAITPFDAYPIDINALTKL